MAADTAPRSSALSLLAALALWLAAPASTMAGEPPPDITAIDVRIAGEAETVFSWRTDRCEDGDIPDAPARAFRDADGSVHLIASHFRTRALTGPSLGAIRPDCRVRFEARGDDDPARWDDRVWLTAFFTADGRTVHALGHAEYHGHLRPARCPAGTYKACWWNAVIGARSIDGGASFHRRPGADAVLAAPPAPYDPTPGRPVGYFSPSNILREGGFHYVFVFAAEHGPQRRGACLLRSADLDDPFGWRAWDGHDFTVPMRPDAAAGTPASTPPCTVIPGIPASIGSVSRLAGDAGFVALIAARQRHDAASEPVAGIYALRSPDLVRWSKPRLVLAAPLMWARTCTDAAVMAYPSLLDAFSPSPSFESVSGRAHLYLTRFKPRDCRLVMERDLVRYPVEIGPPPGATATGPR